MIVLALCGYAQSGKDTAAKALATLGFKRLAFADALRDAVYNLNPIVQVSGTGYYQRVQHLVDLHGWDVAKVEYPEIRRLLQNMGTEVGRELWGDNFWVSRVTQQMEYSGMYVITDVRFPNEANAIHALNGHLIRIVRPGVGAVNGHVSDTGIADLPADHTLVNDGTEEDFHQTVVDYVSWLYPASLGLPVAS